MNNCVKEQMIELSVWMVFFNDYLTCDCDFYKIEHSGQGLSYLMGCENTSMNITSWSYFVAKQMVAIEVKEL